jgi:hypothetical protein
MEGWLDAQMDNNTNEKSGVVGKSLFLHVDDILLDVENPRFGSRSKAITQDDIALKIEMGSDVIKIAESIARTGFFANEPLIVIENKIAGKYTVIEGNRRFTALLCLTSDKVRSKMFQTERLNELASTSIFKKNDLIPCILVENRELIAPILGYRHISGIMEWQPMAQAEFVAKLIDEEGYSFETVAEVVGKPKSDIAGMYRNQAIAKQATEVGMNTSGLENSFSSLTVAMGSPGIRAFISAPLGSAVSPGMKPIPEDHYEELKELLAFLFGDDLRAPVVGDTRQINRLGKIIQNPTGLETLRTNWSLADAEAAIKDQGMDPYTRLLNRLKTANESVKSTFDDISDYLNDASVKEYVQTLHENISSLQNLVEDD